MIIHDTNINQIVIPLPPMFDSCAFQSLFHVPGSMMVQPLHQLGEAARKKEKIERRQIGKCSNRGGGRGVYIFSKFPQMYPFIQKMSEHHKSVGRYFKTFI